MTRLRCLLALALVCVQLLIPLTATAAMLGGSPSLHDICSAAGGMPAGDAGEPGPAASVAGASHCGLCMPAPALPASPVVTPLTMPLPGALLRIGGLWYQPNATVPPLPARAPPATV